MISEPFRQWVIEDHFPAGRPAWETAGAILTDDVHPFETMKLRCLNGAHSTLAYLGQLTGRETVADAMQSPLITTLLDALWLENRDVLHAPRGVDPAGYVEQLKRRFCNPSLKHRTVQIASDGSQKLPQRLLAPLRERLAKGLASPAIATAIAAWMHFVVKVRYTPGGTLSDPMAAEILEQAGKSIVATEIVDHLLGLQKIFAQDLPENVSFRAEVIDKFVELARNPGVATAEQITV